MNQTKHCSDKWGSISFVASRRRIESSPCSEIFTAYTYILFLNIPSFLNNERSGRLYIATLAAKLTHLILGNRNIYCVPLSNLRNSKFLQHKLDLYTKRSPKFRSNTCNGCLRVVYFTRTTIWAQRPVAVLPWICAARCTYTHRHQTCCCVISYVFRWF